MIRLAILTAVCLASAEIAAGMDYLTIRRDGKERQIEGRVVITAVDGGILLQSRDGVLWAVPPEELVTHTSDEKPFRPMSAQEVSKSLLGQLPRGFDVYQTQHYVILHDTSRAYAQWCGALFERLYGAFRAYWSSKDFDLPDPEFPLVAVVFADKQSYLKFSADELGNAGESIIGYYSLTSNRMTMYDLTGTDAARGPGRVSTTAQINQILASPEAVRTVSTIVHEATHQIAFNCGMHARLSDCPRAVLEGIAVFCETPDLRSAKGWKGIGTVNRTRLVEFHKYARNRPADSLRTLLASDKRFLDVNKGPEAYAEAWALTYFLIRQHPKQYVAYLKMLSGKKPLMPDKPEVRVEQFEKCFGDLAKLDTEFLRYMGRVR
jgi:hypothetical protein